MFIKFKFLFFLLLVNLSSRILSFILIPLCIEKKTSLTNLGSAFVFVCGYVFNLNIVLNVENLYSTVDLDTGIIDYIIFSS